MNGEVGEVQGIWKTWMLYAEKRANYLVDSGIERKLFGLSSDWGEARRGREKGRESEGKKKPLNKANHN